MPTTTNRHAPRGDHNARSQRNDTRVRASLDAAAARACAQISARARLLAGFPHSFSLFVSRPLAFSRPRASNVQLRIDDARQIDAERHMAVHDPNQAGACEKVARNLIY